ncbi:MAG: metallophosphoesterase [Gammaproteobacteria bacterium]|jgi:Icc-related predicted phosphoesterase
MKCLLVSDLHYALKQFDWTADAADDYDVVVVGGDHLDISGHVDGRAQIVVILKYLQRLKERTQAVVCSGNHDLDVRNGAGEKVAGWMERVRRLGIPTDGDSLMVGDVLFTICPWWDGPATRQAVADQLARDAAKPKTAWVWVYHAPPEGSPTSQARNHSFGDADLAGWIETYTPDFVLTGHIHQAPFEEGGSWADRIGRTWVFNAGRQIGPTPTHVAIHFGEREAFWSSMIGSEYIDLDAPLERPLRKTAEPPAWLRS